MSYSVSCISANLCIRLELCSSLPCIAIVFFHMKVYLMTVWISSIYCLKQLVMQNSISSCASLHRTNKCFKAVSCSHIDSVDVQVFKHGQPTSISITIHWAFSLKATDYWAYLIVNKVLLNRQKDIETNVDSRYLRCSNDLKKIGATGSSINKFHSSPRLVKCWRGDLFKRGKHRTIPHSHYSEMPAKITGKLWHFPWLS